jgi:molybdopterin-guanine dinucleotide biosynthesis protein A
MRNNFFIGILNGGKSSRMGSPKSLIKYRDKPLIEYIYDIAINITKNVVILGGSPVTERIKDSANIICDDSSFGPLSGIMTGYSKIKTDFLIWAIDMPLVNEEMIKALLEKINFYDGNLIPFNRHINKYETLFAYYLEELLAKASSLMGEDFYSMQHILKHLSIEGDGDFFDKYRNNLISWNTEELMKMSLYKGGLLC